MNIDSLKYQVLHEVVDTIQSLPWKVGIEHSKTSADGSTLNLLLLLLLVAVALLVAAVLVGLRIWIKTIRDRDERHEKREDEREKRRIEREDKANEERIELARIEREDQKERERIAREDKQREQEERERKEDKATAARLAHEEILERQRLAAREEVKQSIDGGFERILTIVSKNSDGIARNENEIRLLDKRVAVVEAVKKDKSST